jgi:hypothetical protein
VILLGVAVRRPFEDYFVLLRSEKSKQRIEHCLGLSGETDDDIDAQTSSGRAESFRSAISEQHLEKSARLCFRSWNRDTFPSIQSCGKRRYASMDNRATIDGPALAPETCDFNPDE